MVLDCNLELLSSWSDWEWLDKLFMSMNLDNNYICGLRERTGVAVSLCNISFQTSNSYQHV